MHSLKKSNCYRQIHNKYKPSHWDDLTFNSYWEHWFRAHSMYIICMQFSFVFISTTIKLDKVLTSIVDISVVFIPISLRFNIDIKYFSILLFYCDDVIYLIVFIQLWYKTHPSVIVFCFKSKKSPHAYSVQWFFHIH